MARRYYITGAPLLALSSGVSDSAVTLTVASTTGYPSVPFTICLERATANEEVCLVTAKSGTTFTVTRGWDGSTAKAHDINAVVEHTTSAVDYNDANAHVYDVSRNDHTQYPLKSLWSAKGALILASAASTPLALTIGANNTLLVADSTQSSGARWSNITAAMVTDGTLTLAKLATALQQEVIQVVADSSAKTALTSADGQEVYQTDVARWYGKQAGAWAFKTFGIGKVTYGTGSAPSSDVQNGDVYLKYT